MEREVANAGWTAIFRMVKDNSALMPTGCWPHLAFYETKGLPSTTWLLTEVRSTSAMTSPIPSATTLARCRGPGTQRPWLVNWTANHTGERFFMLNRTSEMTKVLFHFANASKAKGTCTTNTELQPMTL